jgi:hypothetical protein
LHPAALKPIEDHQYDRFRLVPHEFPALVQQLLQDGLPLQVVYFDAVEFIYVGAERLTFPSPRRRTRVTPLAICRLPLC